MARENEVMRARLAQLLAEESLFNADRPVAIFADIEKVDSRSVNPDGPAPVEASDLIRQQLHPLTVVIKQPDDEVRAPCVLHVESGQSSGKHEEGREVLPVPRVRLGRRWR